MPGTGDEPCAEEHRRADRPSVVRPRILHYANTEAKARARSRTVLWVSTPPAIFVWMFGTMMIAGLVITGLPRTMQGERVIVPWGVCIGVVIGLQLALPVLFAWVIRLETWDKLYVLLWAVASAILLYQVPDFLGGLEKAWRRGW